MTRIPNVFLLSALLLIFSPIASLAATPSTAPKQGDMAVSFNVGFANAFDDHFEDVAPIYTGTFEYFTTPRLSWRGLIGVTSFDADLGGSVSVDSTFVNGNVVYNWEKGRIHPYVTGGVGVYSKNGSSDLPSSFDETVFGLNGGGGLDWFLGARWALKFEGVFHGVTGEDPNRLFFGTAGAMFWF
jgi:hypothetical protein